MANRGKHLLEAFKTAGPGASPPPSSASAPRSASAPSGGGLSAHPAASSSPYGAPTVISLNAPQLRLFGLVVLLLCVVTFLLGRMSVSRGAQAAESGAADKAAPNEAAAQVAPNVPPPSQAAPAAQPPVAAPAGGQPVVDSQAREPAEQALLDRKNVYTIKLVHYSNTQANQRLAAQTAQYIRAQNLPAVVATDGAGLFILVGAAPRQVDLDAYLAQVKRLAGPPPLNRAGEFASAYLEKIDRVFKR